MPTLPIPNTATMELIGQGPAGREETTLSFKLNAPLDNAIAIALKDYALTNLLPDLQGVASDEFAYTSILIHDNMKPIQASYEFPVSPPLAGAIVDHRGSTTTAPVITWRTSLAGRSYRGRAYLPGLPRISAQDDQLDSSIVSRMVAYAVDAQRIEQVVPAAVLAVLSKKLGLATVVLSAVARVIAGTQRRRNSGNGI